MDRVDTITVPKRLPRPAPAADVRRVLDGICARRPRKDYVCGARASEAGGLYVEDFDLALEDEHVRVHGKGGSVRTVLLDDRGYVALLRIYLTRTDSSRGRCCAPASTAAGVAVLFGGISPVAALLRRSRSRHRYTPVAPHSRDRADQRGCLDRGGTQATRARLHRDHSGVRLARRQGRRPRDPRRPATEDHCLSCETIAGRREDMRSAGCHSSWSPHRAVQQVASAPVLVALSRR